MGGLTLHDVTACVVKTAEETPLGIFNTMIAMRSFAKFVAEAHPELPDISAALICAPAKRRRVYEGYSNEEATKILSVIEQKSVKGKWDFAMIMLAYTTGLRGCDIVCLKLRSRPLCTSRKSPGQAFGRSGIFQAALLLWAASLRSKIAP